MSSEREWVVTLHARSSIRLTSLDSVRVTASPQTTVSLDLLRIRNGTARFPDGDEFISGIVVEAKGRAATAEAAVALLANISAAYFQIVALAGNGAVDEPDGLLAYAPPVGRKRGQFIQQRPTEVRAPAAVLRRVDARDLVDLLDAIDRHPRKDRIHRALAHYRMALLMIEHNNWVLAGESLFMAVESLQRVVYLRLLAERGLPETGESKHKLALEHGFTPPSETSNRHLGDFDSHLRAHYIFDDDPIYNTLKYASDHFEHSSKGFDLVREAADVAAEKSFPIVRRTVLRECGLKADAGLFAAKFDQPLGGWRPSLESHGTYAGNVVDPEDPEWPLFLGLNLHPYIADVADTSDTERQITLKVDGNGRSLLGSQEAKIRKTVWIMPGTTDHKPTHVGEPLVVTTNSDEQPPEDKSGL
jgi:hypothetical protein